MRIRSESEWALLDRYIYTYSDRSSTVQQNDIDRIYKYTIRQCTKWQKHNIQYRQLCVRSDVQIWNEKNKCVWWINICIIVLCVPCLMSRSIALGKKCFFVWSFWCSELCSVDQTVIVSRGSVLDVRGPEEFCQHFWSLWMSTVLGEWGGMYQWFAQQSGLPSVVFWGQIW